MADYKTIDMVVRSLLADVLRTGVPPAGALAWGWVDDNGALVSVPLTDLSGQQPGGPTYTPGTGVDLNGTQFSSTRLELAELPTSNYTLRLSDAGKLVPVSSTSAVTVTVPAHADVPFPIGTTLYVAQDGVGSVTITGASGVVVQTADGYQVGGQWLDVALHKRDLNTWVLKGGVS